MYKEAAVSLALALSAFSTVTLPAIAQSVPNSHQSTSSGSTIPASTALTVTFPSSMVVNAKKKQDSPMTLFLAQPLFDSQGRQVVAANAPLVAKMTPTKGGAQIVAESLVINGRVVAIQASSPLIPSYSVTQTSSYQSAREGSACLPILPEASQAAPQATERLSIELRFSEVA